MPCSPLPDRALPPATAVPGAGAAPRAAADELLELERIAESGARWLTLACEDQVRTPEGCDPLYVLEAGSRDPDAPAVGFFGGVHGLERIGTQVLLAFLRGLVARLPWDRSLAQQLERVRLVFMPLVNPAGMRRGTRSNPRGVDLVRNAPVQARRARLLVGGQRLTPRLPWFRGRAGEAMEAESRALCRTVERALLPHPFSLALDCHSGFGLRDRIWFPHAHTPVPIEHLPEIHALAALFESGWPHHDYLFEPQSRHYLAHGDLWDHLYLGAGARPQNLFLPLTLEMGSWRWVKKSPRQLFSRAGIFNPLPAHRHHRVLRRHLLWFEFLIRCAADWRHWAPRGAERERHRQAALRRWYPAGMA